MGVADRALLWAGKTKFEYDDLIRRSSPSLMGRFKFTMQLHNDLQHVLSDSSGKGPQGSRLPEFARNDLLGHISRLEKLGRTTYIYLRMKELVTQEPNMSGLARKRQARAEWENDVIKRYSY